MTDLRPASAERPIIDPADRLIVALDVPSADRARAIVDQLGDAVRFYKIGLELFMTGNYFELLDWLVKRDKKVFVDLKFFDVPETVRSAVRALSSSGATFSVTSVMFQIRIPQSLDVLDL